MLYWRPCIPPSASMSIPDLVWCLPYCLAQALTETRDPQLSRPAGQGASMILWSLFPQPYDYKTHFSLPGFWFGIQTQVLVTLWQAFDWVVSLVPGITTLTYPERIWQTDLHDSVSYGHIDMYVNKFFSQRIWLLSLTPCTLHSW